MADPILKTTITRYVHIVAAVGRPYQGHNSDELAKIDPMRVVAGFPFLPPTATQRPLDHTMPGGDSTLGSPWGPDLGPLQPVAPMGVHADKWSTNSSLVIPSMDPVASPAWNKEIEVKVSQPEASYN